MFTRISDGYSVCCFLNEKVGCFTPPSPFATCDGIFYSWVLRISVWIVSLAALVTNLMVLIGRCKPSRQLDPTAVKPTENIFLANLAVADFLMGIYLVAIAIADAWFGADYFLYSEKWRSGTVCGVIGMIGVLSSVVSLLDLTVMTIDRFFCIVYPFGHIRFNRTWGCIICFSIWLIGMATSISPFFLSHLLENFYGHTDVCLGLPIVTIPQQITETLDSKRSLQYVTEYEASTEDATWVFSSILYTYLSSFCLLIVTVCYVSMFISVRNTRRNSHRPNGNKDEVKMASRMSFIVGTDMLCWFPVVVLSSLSKSGIQIPTQVNPWLVVFVIPFNSALNPFIYSYAILRSKKKNVPGQKG